MSDILSDAPSLAGRVPAALSTSATRVAFKTGTSYGYRDAWAAGHGGGYTIVAWVGFANGTPRPGETGRKAAAPLLFDAFDMLDQKKAPEAVDSNEMPAIALARFAPQSDSLPPEIVFPRDGVEVYLNGATRGFSFSARGGRARYQWYVDGDRVEFDQSSGQAIWYPARAGFYDISVVDGAGRTSKSKVRVLASG